MNHISKTLFITCLSIALLSSCSSSNSLKQAEFDFEYLQLQEADDLLLPEGVEPLFAQHEYTIPELGDLAPKQYLGSLVDIRSPSLVLPITAGSRVEQRGDKVILWMDVPTGAHNMQATLWTVIEDYLASEQIEIEQFSEAESQLDTQWHVLHSEVDSDVYNLRQRYRYNIVLKPHGKTLGLSASLLEHEVQAVEAGAWNKEISAVDKQRYSVQALNKLILFFDARRDEYQKQYIQESDQVVEEPKREFIHVDTSEDTLLSINSSFKMDGETPLLVLDAPYNEIGPSVKHALKLMGFEVNQVIAIDGYVTLKYTPLNRKQQAGIALQALNLDSGDYQLLVGDLKDKTSLLFSDSEGKVLEEWQVQELLTYLQPLLKTGLYPQKNAE